jgi:hypothetical protein
VQKLHDNDRSYVYGYDALQRLIAATQGELDLGGPGVPPAILDPIRDFEWDLDNLGNWTGDGPAAGTTGLTLTQWAAPGAPDPAVTTHDHAVGDDNALQSVTVASAGGPPATTAYVVNAAGNQVFDGSYLYQYDAWNRLVQVNTKGLLSASSFDADGELLEIDPVLGGVPVIGPLVVRLTYDGLGRLITKTTPVEFGDLDCGPGFAAVDCPLRDEHYYYDGVRRLKEVVWRPADVVIVPEGVQSGIEEPFTETSLEPFASMSIVEAHPAGWEQREYIYGTEYVDEFVCQIVSEDDGGGPTGMNRVYYMLQDANYNVVALARANGTSGPNGWTAGDVVEQYVYAPYGEVLASEETELRPPTPGATYKPPLNPAGHQGLFYIRFDEPVTVSPLRAYARGIYHNVNRSYDAIDGRFLSQDDNSTGTPNLTTTAFHGETIHVMIDGFEAQTLYGDGANLFGYLGSNPINRGDALGLWSFGELGAAAGIQGLLAGLISGALNSATGGSFGQGFAGGFIGGALGGATGFLANSAFAASASGLFATFAAHSLVGAADGAVSAFGQSFYSTGDLRSALADAAFGAALGAATGGLADWVVRPGILIALPKGFAAGRLAEHFRKHAAEWAPPISSEAAYLRQASDLLSFPPGGSILQKVRPNGDILRYNTATNEFASMASDGTIRTFFRPTDGINYWNRQ